MKTLLLSFFIILTFNGCFFSSLKKDELKKEINLYSYEQFNYSKKQIKYFEKEFNNILAINNPSILKAYAEFYEKNSSYFINGEQKVKELLKKISTYKITEPTLLKLQKANEANMKESIKIYKDLSKQGNIKAKRELVEIYKITNPNYALKLLEELVALEDIKSMKDYASANIYMIRPVIVQDLKKALKTYKRLDELGELSSTMRLGNFYEYGYHKSVAPKNKALSLQYYEKAALQNYFPAIKKLFEIYSCKNCPSNRYDEKRAKQLQKILQKKLDEKLSKVLNKRN